MTPALYRMLRTVARRIDAGQSASIRAIAADLGHANIGPTHKSVGRLIAGGYLARSLDPADRWHALRLTPRGRLAVGRRLLDGVPTADLLAELAKRGVAEVASARDVAEPRS